MCSDPHFSVMQQGALLVCMSGCAAGAELSLPVPLPTVPTWRSALVCKHLMHLLMCLCNLPSKTSVSIHPCLWEIEVPAHGTTILSAHCTLACTCSTSLQTCADFTSHPQSFGFTWANAEGGGFHGSTAWLERHTLSV